VWGVIGGLPVTLVVVPLGGREFYQIRRVLRRWLGKRLGRRVWWSKDRGSGIKVYLDNLTVFALVLGI
jgi:hypothetical protein